jgi:hypothetical protein
MPATASMMTACTTDSPRRAGAGVGVVDVLVSMGMCLLSGSVVGDLDAVVGVLMSPCSGEVFG